jgi:signal transduction histidine kinase
MTAPPFPFWRHFGRLAPLAVLWIVLVVWLGWLLYSKTAWTQQSDEQDMREWLSETRVFRKSLPELLTEYVELVEQGDAKRLKVKYEEVEAHLGALAEPTRKYSGKLPLFPELYRVGVAFDAPVPAGRNEHPAWVSPMPRPGADAKARVRIVEVPAAGGRARIQCEYRIHTNHRFEEEERARRYWQLPLVAFLVPATALAGFFAFRTLRRERLRELEQAESEREAEHRERELLETRLKQQTAEQEKAKVESRAADAERAALELKSQLYASIGIMAGSYAHNIKNLLVRPNDLLARCLDPAAAPSEQHGMLQEVKSTLGTVTERLQEILRTVRRDPAHAEMTKLDLAELVRASHKTWADTAWDKWKLRIATEIPPVPLFIHGEHSHLQQAVENLIFNARDASFEMRNLLRQESHNEPDPEAKKRRIIESASWKGEVTLRVKRNGANAVLEITDNGIGMSDEVLANCLKTHFTTKRDNALYEGYSAGMGLGLSFVAVVLEHHDAKLEIDSHPRKGATFRITFAAR